MSGRSRSSSPQRRKNFSCGNPASSANSRNWAARSSDSGIVIVVIEGNPTERVVCAGHFQHQHFTFKGFLFAFCDWLTRSTGQVTARIPDAPHDHGPHIWSNVLLVEVGKCHILSHLKLITTLRQFKSFCPDELEGVFQRECSNAKPDRPSSFPRGDPEGTGP